MRSLQVFGELSPHREPGIAYMTAVEHLWAAVGRPHVMAEVTGCRSHVEAVRL